jgi:hypothetical protein
VFSFAPGITAGTISRVFDDVYGILDEIGSKRPSVLFLDEFQAVTDLDEHLPHRLKALADQHRNVSLVLAGSKQHLMESLVLSRGAPLYNMLERFSLGAIPVDDWVPFLTCRARDAGKPFADNIVAQDLWKVAGPVPFDVQQLAYESFNQADVHIDHDVLVRATEELIHHETADYAKSFERLSAGQRRVLKALAITSAATTGSAEFAAGARLADSTSVRKAITVLVESELVVMREQSYAVDDPFFAVWLRGQNDLT